MLLQKAVHLCLAGSSVAHSVRSPPQRLNERQEPTPTSAPAAQSTACGEIIADVDENGTSIFPAKNAYACLSSVPFNPAVATRFLKYWNETLQLQSTLTQLKSPPKGYQQPAVDVQEEIANIQLRIDTGFYASQYAFETDVQLLTYALHDGHVSLSAGILAAFSFGSPFEIASVSTDGNESPKIYLTGDIIWSQMEGWTPSAIDTINGEPAIDFLTKFAALNSAGYLEPHAEWNALMSSPVLDIQSGQTVWAGAATFFPGESLTIHFENYTATDDTTFWETEWEATYNEFANFTGPLATGGDFYNYFVLGNTPDSFDPDRIVEPEVFADPEPAPGNWKDASFGAFPESPDVAQFDLGPATSGYVSGYFFDDISTGVLSLPSFAASDESVGNYSGAVRQFIIDASKAGMQNVIIDLQRNQGGLTFLAYTTFKVFFPDLMPFGGSRRRITPLSDALGSATTKFWDLLDESDRDELDLKYSLGADNWLITNRLNTVNGKNFTSWEEYATAVNVNGDTFSQTEQYDLANKEFDLAAFLEWYPVMYIEEEKSDWPFTERHWNPDQISILTDGICSSSCSLFVEMMTRAGVKTVVAGGRPQTGPMQAVSGNRGAAVYSTDEMDIDLSFVRDLDEFVDDNVNATVPEIRDPGMWVTSASINLRDQIRKDDTTPLQLKYEAADCRVYYTLANLYNMTRLWHDVAAAIADPSLCVEGSTGYSTTNNSSPAPPPVTEAQRPTLAHEDPIVEQVQLQSDPSNGLRNAKLSPSGSTAFQPCTQAEVGTTCSDGNKCKRVGNLACSDGTTLSEVFACLPVCHCFLETGTCSRCDGQCKTATASTTKDTTILKKQTQGRLNGRCFPDATTLDVNTQALGCPRSTVAKPVKNSGFSRKPKGSF